MKLDQIYAISLVNSKERQKRLKKWIPKDKVTWWLVKRNKDPKLGCFTSHRDIFLDAKSKGYKYIAIFEDDAIPVFDWKRAENEIENFLENPPKTWKLLALGYYPVIVRKTNRPNLVSIGCSFATHAYLANLDNISIPEWNGTQIDDLMFCDGVAQKLDFKHLDLDRDVYGVKPILFNQFSKVSTINNVHTLPQYISEKFGNENILENSQKVNLVLLATFIVFLILSLFVIIPVSILCAKSKCEPVVLWVILSVFVLFFLVFVIMFLVDCVKLQTTIDVDSE